MRGEPQDEQVSSIFRLLRHPLSAAVHHPSGVNWPEQLESVKNPTKNLLSILEHVPGVHAQFGGDLWKVIEWAEAEQKEGRLKGLDLDSQLQLP
jgi:hypothetical protein